MPISRAIARSDTASGPCSTSSRRAVAVISSIVAARSRSRRVSEGDSVTYTSRLSFTARRRPAEEPSANTLDGGKHCMRSYLRTQLTVFTKVIMENSSSSPGRRAMFEAWGRGLYRARRLTLVIAVVFALAAGAWGTGVFSKLTSGNTFTPPNSQSNRETDLAASVFGRNDADVVVLYRSPTMTVADPAYRQAVTAELASLPSADVKRVTTYWSTGSGGFVSANRHETYAVLELAGS